MKKITDKDFRYISAANTDVGATIRREIRRLAKLKGLTEKFPPKVTQIKREAK